MAWVPLVIVAVALGYIVWAVRAQRGGGHVPSPTPMQATDAIDYYWRPG